MAQHVWPKCDALDGADGNGDGVVDKGDYVVWRKHITTSGAGAGDAATVPEPCGVVLVLMACGMFAVLRNRSLLVGRCKK